MTTAMPGLPLALLLLLAPGLPLPKNQRTQSTPASMLIGMRLRPKSPSVAS